MSTFEEVHDTQLRNHTFQHYDRDTVFVPFQHLRMLSRTFHQQRVSIATDRRLTNEGKEAALALARTNTRKAIEDWHSLRLKNLDADLLEQRAALVAHTSKPDPKRVDMLASHLRQFTPHEINVVYSAATDPERREIEEASALLGRLPIKTEQGIHWRPLLDAEVANEAILARAEQTNPAAAQKVKELEEIRRIQVTMTGVALSEI